MKLNWKIDKKGKSSSLQVGEYPTKLSIDVTCTHIYHPDMWVMHCKELNISEMEIGRVTANMTIEEAKTTAIDIIKSRLHTMYQNISQ